MPRVTLDEVKTQKNYYRDKLRMVVKLNLVSLIMMNIIVLGIYYQVLVRPEHKFYATNSAGAGFIHELKAMRQRNSLPKALLKPDPPEEMHLNRDLGVLDAE